MKKMGLSNLVILSLCAAGFSQSPLSVHFPLGMPLQAVGGPSASMAGSGTAVVDEYLGATLNPANMAIGSRAAFSALISYDNVKVKDKSGSSSVSGYSPKLLSLILPLGKSSNLTFAMQKQYDANLNLFTENTLDNISDPTVTNTIELQNTGGLTSWQAGWGYRFKNRISVGFVYERLFFNSESRNTFESSFAYHNGATFTSSIRETEISSFSSNGVRFGMQIPVHEKVTAGVSAQYVLYADKTGSLTREYQRSDSIAPHEKSKEKFSVHLPPSVSAGLCYEPNNKWLLALDLHSTIWERYDNNGLAIPKGLRTTYGTALGTSFTPATNRLSAKYWEKTQYRTGISYNQLPLEKSQEYMATVGVGLPIPDNGGLIDIIFGYGRRSADKYSGYSETVTKFELGINGGRSWFQKTAAKNY